MNPVGTEGLALFKAATEAARPLPAVSRRHYGYPETREPLARAEGPQTSRDAAVRAFADQAAQQSIIHNFLRGRGALGTTAREIATGTGLTMEQVCRRLPEMRDAAMVSTANGKDGPGCLPLERREGCAIHWAREYAPHRKDA